MRQILTSRVSLLLGAIALAALFAGCSSPPKPYNITLADVDAAVDKLMDKLEGSELLTEIRATGTRPGIAVDLLTNETDQRVSTERILQSFETRVVNMRTFEVVSYKKTLTGRSGTQRWKRGPRPSTLLRYA